MEKILIAFATDDGNTFINRHFGDSKYFDIYEVKEGNFEFVKRIQNTSEKEKFHADPEKAKGVSGLLLKEKVNVVAAKIFGPNLSRIQKKFFCFIVKISGIDDCLDFIAENSDSIRLELEKKEPKKVFVIEKKGMRYAENKTV